MNQSDERTAAYQKLDEAVRELHRLVEAEQPDPPAVAADYVLIVGAVYFGEDGSRSGLVEVFPQRGSQPPYITTGLLQGGHAERESMTTRHAASTSWCLTSARRTGTLTRVGEPCPKQGQFK